MRTFVLLGVATVSLVLAGRAGAEAPAVESRAATDLAGSASFGDHGKPALDYGAPADPDVRVYTGHADRIPSESEYRRVSGYDAEGRWTGTWSGTYEAPDGRRYDGTYEGSVEGHGAGYPPPPHHYYGGGYDPQYDMEMERRCGRGGTVGGAVVGGVVGGVVGNRIAGRGNRTEGTIIGGALGAAAGAAIGDAADKKKCDEWWARRGSHHSTTTYHHGGYGHGYGYGYGYGYYTPGVVVTTTITHGAPVITETVETTTKTYYENVPVRKRYVAKKKWKPKPKAKPRCVC
jgi:hypothetical protein